MSKDEEIEILKATIARLEERNAWLLKQLFGAKSEKKKSKPTEDNGQTFPGFLEEYDKQLAEKDEAIKAKVADIEVERKERREKTAKESQRPSKYTMHNLPIEEVVENPAGIDLSKYDLIESPYTDVLHHTSARWYIKRIVRPKYRLKKDKNSDTAKIIQAPAPAPIIRGNHVAAEVLAEIVTNKFVYHIPEYRMVKMFADNGIKMPTSTINDWVHAVANKLYPLYEAHLENVLASDYLQIDEVPWRIADKEGKCRPGYAWQFLDGSPESRGALFYYNKGSRAGTIPRALLQHFKGAIQTDGYKVYDYFEEQPDIVLLGCMAHVRRKFVEAEANNYPLARKALEYIRSLYDLEANLRDRQASLEEIRSERQDKAIPILDAFEAWMQVAIDKCTPADTMGRALDYAYKMLPRLRRYALDGRYNIDNNPVERGQRPTVLGRKNYLFSKNNRGAEDNAIFYSFFVSCDLAGINPLRWMTDVLSRLHNDSTEEEIVAMLPANRKADLK